MDPLGLLLDPILEDQFIVCIRLGTLDACKPQTFLDVSRLEEISNVQKHWDFSDLYKT